MAQNTPKKDEKKTESDIGRYDIGTGRVEKKVGFGIKKVNYNPVSPNNQLFARLKKFPELRTKSEWSEDVFSSPKSKDQHSTIYKESFSPRKEEEKKNLRVAGKKTADLHKDLENTVKKNLSEKHQVKPNSENFLLLEGERFEKDFESSCKMINQLKLKKEHVESEINKKKERDQKREETKKRKIELSQIEKGKLRESVKDALEGVEYRGSNHGSNVHEELKKEKEIYKESLNTTLKEEYARAKEIKTNQLRRSYTSNVLSDQDIQITNLSISNKKNQLISSPSINPTKQDQPKLTTKDPISEPKI